MNHFTSPEGIPGVPETNFNNRPNSFKVLSPARSCVVCLSIPGLSDYTISYHVHPFRPINDAILIC